MTARRLVVRALLAAVAAAGTFAIVRLITGGNDTYTVRAVFADAAGLRKDYSVRIGGVSVGRVADLRLDRHDRVIAQLRVDKSAGPIAPDAVARIRPSNLLGEKYVDLQPGDVRHPLPSGSTIPVARTSAPTELDDLLDVFDTPTRSALEVFLSEQGRALAGRGVDLAGALASLPPALDQAQELAAGLGHDNRAIARLVVESDRVLASVGRERRSLGRFVDSAGGALESFASRRAQLGDTIRRAPAAIAQMRHSLVALRQAALPLGPAARGLQATAAPLTAMLDRLPPFVAAATPALRTARAVSPDLLRLGREATPVVQRLVPLGSDLDQFARDFDPASAILDEAFPDMLGIMEGWARTVQGRDAAGHVFRAGLTAGSELIPSLDDYIRGVRRAQKKTAAGRPAPQLADDSPAHAIHSPGAGRPLVVPPPMPHLPDGVPPAPPTGEPPVQKVLDYLLGP